MKSIKGSQTEKNLLTAFAGESQARNRYTYFGGAARKEGLMQIADIFEETADQERMHAKRFFSFLEGGSVEIKAAFPAGVIGSLADNLREASAGEKMEWSEMYPGFACTAREEGFEPVARLFEAVCVAERQHEKRYLDLLGNVERDEVLSKPEEVVWRCRKCGYLHRGKSAPSTCICCAHPRGWFELLGENW